MSRSLTVLAPGPLCTVQDDGRPGLAATGVGRSGACDRRSARLANRLVGNPVGAAVLEVVLGGLVLRADGDLVVVTTGARCSEAHNGPLLLAAGQELALGVPATGLRTYVAVRGGLDVPPVLGSRSTDLLAGLGPPQVAAGDVLPVGPPAGPAPGVDLAPVADPEAGDVRVAVTPGPRWDWFPPAAHAALLGTPYTMTSESNRIGLRLEGEALQRAVTSELPTEGMTRGALQVPASG